MARALAWTSPADLRRQVRRFWDRGRILASMATGETLFPLRLPIRRPTAAELRDHFDEARTWSASLRSMRHVRIVMREFRHRVSGANALPHEAWIDTVEDAVALVGKRREVATFEHLVQATRSRQPSLLGWIARRPLKALQLADDWSRLLDVVDWLQAHPRPGIYLRQMDVPGVHSKFVEARYGVLGELLDCVLPPESIDPAATGAGGFARRYGFLDRPERIRFRILDTARILLPGDRAGAPVRRDITSGRDPVPDRTGRDALHRDGTETVDLAAVPTGQDLLRQDVTLDAKTFAALDCEVSRVFVTENEINFLAFPGVTDGMVVFGAGYGFESLGQAQWLSGCRVLYWGDIDTHGFAILDELRSHFAHVESFLMDRSTFLAFEPLWGTEGSPIDRELSRLTAEERGLYDDLRLDRIGPALRLEQEHIGFDWVRRRLDRLRAGERR